MVAARVQAGSRIRTSPSSAIRRTAGHSSRTADSSRGLVAGLEMVDPGLESISLWRRDPADAEVKPVDAYGAVARKP